jgi:Transmembrane protein 43
VTLPDEATLPTGWQRGDVGLFHGRDPMVPAIGDLRVSFRAVLAGTASVIAGQHADGLATYQAPDGSTIALATTGTASAPAMLSSERSQARILAWILRFVGFGLSLAGLVLMVRPLAVLVSVLPVLETVVDVAATVVMAGVAALLTLGTIAIARIVLQPLLSLGLLAAGLVIAVICVRLRRPGPPRPALAMPRAG